MSKGFGAQPSQDLTPSVVVKVSEAPKTGARVVEPRQGAPQSSALPMEGRYDSGSL